jgi:hypothetical protein
MLRKVGQVSLSRNSGGQIEEKPVSSDVLLGLICLDKPGSCREADARLAICSVEIRGRRARNEDDANGWLGSCRRNR